MNAAVWNSLEVAKLAVAALVPIAVVCIGLPVARGVRRIEQAQWEDRKLIELRLTLYAEMARPLNDLLCFFRLINDFQAITPPEALKRKRELDKAFFVNKYLMSEEFEVRYKAFIDACFITGTGIAKPAQLRASRVRQRQERTSWDDAWDDLLIPASATPTEVSELEKRYEALMNEFQQEIGMSSPGDGQGRGLRRRRAA